MAFTGRVVPGKGPQLRFPKGDGLADGLGDGPSVSRFDRDYSALRATWSLLQAQGHPAVHDLRFRASDLRPDRFLRRALLLCRRSCRRILGWMEGEDARRLYLYRPLRHLRDRDSPWSRR